MSKPSKSIAFIVNGQETANIGADGQLKPLTTPEVRVEQIYSRAELGRQAWIVEKFGGDAPGDSNSSLAS
jgi:hypothetical protein